MDLTQLAFGCMRRILGESGSRVLLGAVIITITITFISTSIIVTIIITITIISITIIVTIIFTITYILITITIIIIIAPL